MARRIFVHDPPDQFSAGTLGVPGERVFFLQAVSGSEVCSVRLDKDQVRVLAERSLDVLDQTRNRRGR